MHLSALHTEVRRLVRRDASLTMRRSGDRPPTSLAASERSALRVLRRRLCRASDESARLMPDASSAVWTVAPRNQTAE
jgi:hypothetical protein